MSSKPGEEFEPRQTATSEDYTPDPSKSIKLSPQRQALIDDIIALYSCEPTIKRVERYTPDCVYDDQFVYSNNRFVIRLHLRWGSVSLSNMLQIQDGRPMVRAAQALQG